MFVSSALLITGAIIAVATTLTAIRPVGAGSPYHV